MTRNVLRSIVVNVPPERAYAVWSDFENFPQFMAPIVRVRQDGRRLFWRAVFDGQADEWEAQVVELSPYRRVAWHASSGRHHHVVVTMRPLDPAQTEVTLGAEYNASPQQHERRALRYEEYLRAFKELIEIPPAGALTERLPEQAGEFS
jgi:uncharacterized membrane protein